jgi:hypothetical protein
MLRHHEFNPLVSRPFVTLPDGRHIAPQPHFVFQRLSPSAPTTPPSPPSTPNRSSRSPATSGGSVRTTSADSSG